MQTVRSAEQTMEVSYYKARRKNEQWAVKLNQVYKGQDKTVLRPSPVHACILRIGSSVRS
jgi:hypothetical protein